MNRLANFMIGLAGGFMLVTVAVAETPRDVADLVGARGSSGEDGLENAGYMFINSEKGGDRVWSNWWNQRTGTCVSVATVNGRYENITKTTPSDCNRNSSSADHDSDSDEAAALAIGAAALIGAIALAHKSHHHDDNQHYDDVNQDAEFERGYRDGLYGHSYHNYNDASEYSRGYEAGVSQNDNETSYRQQHHSGNAGYRASVNVNDLVGARGSSAESELEGRGFRSVDGGRSGNAPYVIWWNQSTRQCLQMITVEGRVDSLTDIHTHPSCR